MNHLYDVLLDALNSRDDAERSLNRKILGVESGEERMMAGGAMLSQAVPGLLKKVRARLNNRVVIDETLLGKDGQLELNVPFVASVRLLPAHWTATTPKLVVQHGPGGRFLWRIEGFETVPGSEPTSELAPNQFYLAVWDPNGKHTFVPVEPNPDRERGPVIQIVPGEPPSLKVRSNSKERSYHVYVPRVIRSSPEAVAKNLAFLQSSAVNEVSDNKYITFDVDDEGVMSPQSRFGIALVKKPNQTVTLFSNSWFNTITYIQRGVVPWEPFLKLHPAVTEAVDAYNRQMIASLEPGRDYHMPFDSPPSGSASILGGEYRHAAPLWEWIYQIPVVASFAKPLSTLLFALAGSPHLAHRVREGEHSLTFVLAGSVALLLGIPMRVLLGEPFAILPPLLLWAFTSGYAFGKAHWQKTPRQRLTLSFVGGFLSMATVAPFMIMLGGVTPEMFVDGSFGLQLGGRLLSGLAWGLPLNMGLHWLYNFSVAVGRKFDVRWLANLPFASLADDEAVALLEAQPWFQLFHKDRQAQARASVRILSREGMDRRDILAWIDRESRKEYVSPERLERALALLRDLSPSGAHAQLSELRRLLTRSERMMKWLLQFSRQESGALQIRSVRHLMILHDYAVEELKTKYRSTGLRLTGMMRWPKRWERVLSQTLKNVLSVDSIENKLISASGMKVFRETVKAGDRHLPVTYDHNQYLRVGSFAIVQRSFVKNHPSILSRVEMDQLFVVDRFPAHPSHLIPVLAALHDMDLADAVVEDDGTGTGILAMIALRMGARRVLAIDSDVELLKDAHKNLSNAGHRGHLLPGETWTQSQAADSDRYILVPADLEEWVKTDSKVRSRVGGGFPSVRLFHLGRTAGDAHDAVVQDTLNNPEIEKIVAGGYFISKDIPDVFSHEKDYGDFSKNGWNPALAYIQFGQLAITAAFSAFRKTLPNRTVFFDGIYSRTRRDPSGFTVGMNGPELYEFMQKNKAKTVLMLAVFAVTVPFLLELGAAFPVLIVASLGIGAVVFRGSREGKPAAEGTPAELPDPNMDESSDHIDLAGRSGRRSLIPLVRRGSLDAWRPAQSILFDQADHQRSLLNFSQLSQIVGAQPRDTVVLALDASQVGEREMSLISDRLRMSLESGKDVRIALIGSWPNAEKIKSDLALRHGLSSKDLEGIILAERQDRLDPDALYRDIAGTISLTNFSLLLFTDPALLPSSSWTNKWIQVLFIRPDGRLDVVTAGLEHEIQAARAAALSQ